jgi:IQ calmodulin-binding motif
MRVLVCQRRYRLLQQVHRRAVDREVATRKLQRAWKRHLVRQWQRNLAAVAIQAIWRGYFAQVCFHFDLLSIVDVQAVVRRRAAQRLALQRLWAVGTIQQSARACLQRKRHIELLNFAAGRIQAVCRSYRAQRQYAQVRQCVVAIQTQCRMHQAKKRRLLLMVALEPLIRLQSLWRSRVQRAKFVHLRLQCIRIQSLLTMALVRQGFLAKRAQCVRIQACWRRHQSQCTFECWRRCAVSIQKCARVVLSKNNVRLRCQSILQIQSAFRRFLAFRELQSLKKRAARRQAAAVHIQARWRSCVAKATFRLVIGDIVAVQSALRMFFAKATFEKAKIKVTLIQSISRMWLAGRERRLLEARKVLCERSCVRIQSLVRGYFLRREFAVLTLAATVLQCAFRRHLAMSIAATCRKNVIRLQQAARLMVAVRSCNRRRRSIVILQSFSRQVRAVRLVGYMREERRIAALEDLSCFVIQTSFRSFLVRREILRTRAATAIQSIYRCYLSHAEYMLMLLSAMTVQRVVRGYLTACRFRRMKKAVRRIQSSVRPFLVHQKTERERNRAATLVQSHVLARIAKTEFQAKRRAAIFLQSHVRKLLVKMRAESQFFAASEFQRIWRGHRQQCLFRLQLLAFLKFQSLFRRRFRAKRELERRRVLAARVLQQLLRRLIFLRRVKSIRRGTVSLQAAVRGVLCRRRRSKVIVDCARSIARANKIALSCPDKQIGARTLGALEILRTSKRLSTVMAAVCTLELSTRLSSKCCYQVVEAGAPSILFGLLRSANRSLPYIELITHILLTLLNLSVHDGLLDCLATMEGVVLFLDMLQTYRDKDSVFCHTVSLLNLCVPPSGAFQVRSSVTCLRQPEILADRFDWYKRMNRDCVDYT